MPTDDQTKTIDSVTDTQIITSMNRFFNREVLEVQVIHGPNLNLLGQRDQSIYGNMTLDNINQQIVSMQRILDLLVNVINITERISIGSNAGNSVDGIIIIRHLRILVLPFGCN